MRWLRPTWVEVDLDDIKSNLNNIRNFVSKKTKIGAVIKCNAYGHGAIDVAKLLEKESIDYLCVASLNEAIEIRNANIKLPILIMGYVQDYNLDICINNDITVTVFSMNQAVYLSDVAKKLNKVAKIHIKIDTGFNRLGFKINENTEDEIRNIYNLENINVEGIFSHLALKDVESDYKQYNMFKDLLHSISDLDIPIKHICDSIGMVAYLDFHMDMIRVGASLYGYNSRKNNLNLKEAITFKSKICQIKDIKKNEGIGYDYSYVANKDMKIATVCCGYGDGISRMLSNKGYVYVNNKKANIIGKICMDQCVIDVTNIDDVKKDSEVVFYGKNGPNLLDVANIANTNRNELLSLISRRVNRVYIKDDDILKVIDYLNY